MKKIWLMGLTILIVGLWSNLSFAGYKPGSEPDEFRGIKWGTDIKTLKGMKYFLTYRGIKVYKRKNEDLRIGGAKLENIGYSFWGGKFCNVLVTTKGYTNWTGLKEAVFEKLGKGNQFGDQFIENYDWFGDITGMSLEYNEFSEKGKLFMYSEEITKQIKAYKKEKAKEKAKEGAEEGF